VGVGWGVLVVCGVVCGCNQELYLVKQFLWPLVRTLRFGVNEITFTLNVIKTLYLEHCPSIQQVVAVESSYGVAFFTHIVKATSSRMWVAGSSKEGKTKTKDAKRFQLYVCWVCKNE
jgi:hypothetical protein